MYNLIAESKSIGIFASALYVLIKDVKIMLTHDTDKYENISNKKMLEMCEKFFTYLQSELEKGVQAKNVT